MGPLRQALPVRLQTWRLIASEPLAGAVTAACVVRRRTHDHHQRLLSASPVRRGGGGSVEIRVRAVEGMQSETRTKSGEENHSGKKKQKPGYRSINEMSEWRR